MHAFLLSFGVIFIAELGDKSQLMALTLAARYKALPVLIGITIATALVHAVSVVGGALLGASIPTRAITIVAGIAFVGFGAWTLRGDELTEAEKAKAEQTNRSAIAAASVAFFIAELGDKTMLATITWRRPTACSERGSDRRPGWLPPTRWQSHRVQLDRLPARVIRIGAAMSSSSARSSSPTADRSCQILVAMQCRHIVALRDKSVTKRSTQETLIRARHWSLSVRGGESGEPGPGLIAASPQEASWPVFLVPRVVRVTSLIGTLTLVAGFALVVMSAMAGAVTQGGAVVPATQNVTLHNNTSDSTDCPKDADPTTSYWHFIIAPNSGTYSFVTITLNVGGTTFVFSGSQIIPNGTQTDNVFVAVPAGYTVTDLQTSGSSADMTPATPAPSNFVLSGTCVCTQTTTTTVASSTTTRITTTYTSTSTTIPQVTTTIPQVTTTIPQVTTTIPQVTTTIPQVTTTIPQVTTTIPQVTTTIPQVTTTIPQVTTTIPQVTTTIPQVTTTIPQVTTTIPQVTTTIPQVTTTIPQVTTTIPQVTTTIPHVTTTTIPTTTTLGNSLAGESQELGSSATTGPTVNPTASTPADAGSLPRTGGGAGSGLLAGLGLLFVGARSSWAHDGTQHAPTGNGVVRVTSRG